MIIKSRIMRGSGQVACVTEMRNTWKFGISKVLTGLAMKKYCFMQCDDGVVGIYQCFGGTCCLNRQGRRATEAGSSSKSTHTFQTDCIVISQKTVFFTPHCIQNLQIY